MMTREKYQTLKVTDLKELAKSRGVKGSSAMKKDQLINLMLALDTAEAASSQAAPAQPAAAKAPEAADQADASAASAGEKEAAAPRQGRKRAADGARERTDGRRKNARGDGQEKKPGRESRVKSQREKNGEDAASVPETKAEAEPAPALKEAAAPQTGKEEKQASSAAGGDTAEKAEPQARSNDRENRGRAQRQGGMRRQNDRNQARTARDGRRSEGNAQGKEKAYQGGSDKTARTEGGQRGNDRSVRNEGTQGRGERFVKNDSPQGRYERSARNEDVRGRGERPARNEEAQGRYERPLRNEEAQGRYERSARNRDLQGRGERPVRNEEARSETVRPVQEAALQSAAGEVETAEAARMGNEGTSGDVKNTEARSFAASSQAPEALPAAEAGDLPGADRPSSIGGDSVSAPGYDSTRVPGSDSAPAPGYDGTPAVRADSAPSAGADSAPSAGADSAPAAVSDGTPAAVPDSTPGPRNDAAPAPRQEGAPQGIPGDNGNVAKGILEVMPEGYGFLRSDNFLSGDDDVYVSPSQIRRFNLKTGDMVVGNKRDKAQGERYGALLYVNSVNDLPPDEARRRPAFENMTPIFPNERIRLERGDGSTATRVVDLISPIGKGQRGMIVSPPKAGKTTLLKDIARSILAADPDAYLMILLIDERPEEVTDMKESVSGKNVDIIYSTFDELPDHHRRVAEMVIERAKRLVEHKKDVIILLDSITRLARACNVLVPPSGRTLSGGLDPTALYMPKRFFGAARNMREGGSLTILATALVDTGSKMDDVVYEEFKGTGNMELILDRKLQERRIFPAVDIVKSGTRRDDLLLSEKEMRAVDVIRRRINGMKAEEAVDALLTAFAKMPTNEMVINSVLTKWI